MVVFIATIISNMKLMVIETKPDQSKNNSMKLNHTWKTLEIIQNKSETWKILLAIAINFIFSKEPDEEPVTYSMRENIGILIYNKADEAFKKLFESLLHR